MSNWWRSAGTQAGGHFWAHRSVTEFSDQSIHRRVCRKGHQVTWTKRADPWLAAGGLVGPGWVTWGLYDIVRPETPDHPRKHHWRYAPVHLGDVPVKTRKLRSVRYFKHILFIDNHEVTNFVSCLSRRGCTTTLRFRFQYWAEEIFTLKDSNYGMLFKLLNWTTWKKKYFYIQYLAFESIMAPA